jgi:outer membrane murein-binding lipoprotein Lpp
MRRRMGRALVAGAVVGGVAHHAGRVSAQNDAREQQQTAQIADLQAQQDQTAQQQQMAQQPQYAPPPPQYAPPPPQYAPPPPQYAPPPPQYAPVEAPSAAAPAPAPAQPDRIAQLKELGELKAAGVLTEEEFQAEKAKILNS